MRQMPNLRYTARGRPHIWHRRLRRVVNFGVCFAFANFDLLATVHSLFCNLSVDSSRQQPVIVPWISQATRYFFLDSFTSSVWNGMPICVSSSRDSSSVAFLITKVMF